MSKQTALELFPHVARKQPPAQFYEITVKDRPVHVKFEPDYCPVIEVKGKLFGVQHFEFRTDQPGPISESGYRSHFINGTREELGITTQSAVLRLAQEIGDELAAGRYDSDRPKPHPTQTIRKVNKENNK